MSEISERIREIIQPLIEEKKFELYEVEFKKETQGWVLRIFVDNQTRNITLDECADLSHVIGEHFDDIENMDLHNFSLEVSSPGLDRLLRNDSDFNWAMGKTLKVKFTNTKNKKEVIEGKLEKVNPETIELSIDKKNRVTVQKNSIESARRVMKFDELLPKKVKGKGEDN
jgi:ribosome maturation factor RimP